MDLVLSSGSFKPILNQGNLLVKTLISSKDYKIQNWKNGLGTTSEIDLVKDEMGAAFAWRISAATLVQDSDFSLYPGCLRILSIWKGQGLWLNEEQLQPWKPFYFSGDTKIKSRLTDGPVLDLGIIFDPKKVQARLRVYQNLEISLDADVHYLVAAEGGFKVDEVFVMEGDTLKIENHKSALQAIQLKPLKEGPVRIFDVNLKKGSLIP